MLRVFSFLGFLHERQFSYNRFTRRYYEVYACSKDGQCPITLRTRKNCQFCRFQACEQRAFMKRGWVIADQKVTPARANKGGKGGSAVKIASSRGPGGGSRPKKLRGEELPREPLAPLDPSDAAAISAYVSQWRQAREGQVMGLAGGQKVCVI